MNAMTSIKEKLKNTSVFNVVLFVLLVVFSLSLVLPFLYALLTSFKTVNDYRINAFGFPNPFTFENYIISYSYFYVQIATATRIYNVYFPQLVLNTVIYSVGCALMATITPCVMAYLVARFKCKFSSVIYGTVLVCMVIPVVGSLPSEIAMARMLHLYDTFIGIIIMRTNFLGMYFLVMHASVKSLPAAFAESAKIDGAGNLSIFIRIYIPLLKNVLLTVFLIKFIEFWNEYQTPLLYMPSHPTLAYGLNQLVVDNRETQMSWDVRKLAACMIVFVPVFALFIGFHKKIMGNVTLGGVKG